MKSSFLFIVLLPAILLMASCQKHSHDHAHDEAHDHQEAGHHHEEQSNVGPGFAVLAADPHTGIRLSEKAIRTIGVKTLPVSSEGKIVIPHAGIVHDRNKTGIYRLRNGWFLLVPIEENKSSDHEGELVISSPDLKVGDQVVVSGTPLLRVTELDLFAEDVEGHSH